MPKSWRDVRRSDGVGWQLVKLQDELANKTHHVAKLETLLRARTARIDELTSRLEQVRAANARLDRECERLVEMVKLS
jgi:chromosome segregation ATPase